MIGKWLQELEEKGSILDYEVVCDNITNEYVVNYYVPPVDTTLVFEFTIDPVTKEIHFKGEENESC
jgi:hypothetical protein